MWKVRLLEISQNLVAQLFNYKFANGFVDLWILEFYLTNFNDLYQFNGFTKKSTQVRENTSMLKRETEETENVWERNSLQERKKFNVAVNLRVKHKNGREAK